MANRSTFSSKLPRNIGRFISLSRSPLVKHDKDMRKLFKGAGPECYEREIRKLFLDAHAHHKAFKLQRLAKDMMAEIKADVATAVAASL